MCELEVERPATVRSLIKLRSNSANEANILKINLPLVVLVLMFSVKLLNLILLFSKELINSIKSFNDLPSLSTKRQTISSSPALNLLGVQSPNPRFFDFSLGN